MAQLHNPERDHAMTNGLSLYTIEDGLAELLEARQQTLSDIAKTEASDRGGDLAEDLAEQRDALAMIEKTLAEYQSLEVRKVDNCHRFLSSIKHLVPALKAEAAAITARARRLEASGEWLKERIMQAMELGGKKRVDGESGRYLMRKGNGGLAKLHVDGWDDERKQWTTQEGVLDERFIDVTVTLPASQWEWLIELAEIEVPGMVLGVIGNSRSAPSNERIRVALAEQCALCAGRDAVDQSCTDCSGTGKNKVPGARLLERGQHLEVK